MPLVADLEMNAELFAESDIVAAIAGDAGARSALTNRISDPDPNRPDTDPPSQEYLVLDADSSQHTAINRVLGGESLVIQGPPGTGKSQTIANLIAALIARGKRILFVAEKRAAIEAVTKRLEHVGLLDLVLDLYYDRIAYTLSPASVESPSTPRTGGYSPSPWALALIGGFSAAIAGLGLAIVLRRNAMS